MRVSSSALLVVFSAVIPVCFGAATASGKKAPLDQQLQGPVHQYLAKYCVACHSGKSPAAQFDLTSYSTIHKVTSEFPRWTLVAERLEAKTMPPKPIPPPPAEETRKVIDWIQAVRAEEMHRSAGDPGQVPARRLSNAEYNYTIRDLTGQDMQVTREFPVDPANTAGFDNSGESLTMSPALLNKYLQAAREIANHMVLSPDSIDFAPYPMLVETDREKYAIQRIMDFYKSQPTKYADYFQAAWRYKYRAKLGNPRATLASIATESKVSAKYLPMIWELLNEPGALGPVLKLQTMWRELPAPAGTKDVPQTLAPKCVAMQEFVHRIRAHTAMQFATPKVRGLPSACQPLQNYKLKEFTAHHRDSDPRVLLNDTDAAPPVPDLPARYPGLHQDAAPRWAIITARARAGDKDLIVPAAQRKQYEAAFERFASVFPDNFYITERGRYWPDDSQDRGRLLSAGYHNSMGYYRDDTALSELILDEKGQKQLNRLWDEFDFVAHHTERTWVQWYFNNSGAVDGKGAESGSPRPVGHEVNEPEVIAAMRDKYLKKAAADASNDPNAPTAMHDYFDGINATLRHIEQETKSSEPQHLQALVRFAARAYRRPLTKAESEDVLAYYRTLRSRNQLGHVDAVRETIVSVLMSPDFLYRVDLQSNAAHPGSRAGVRKVAMKSSPSTAARPLTNYELASRLSYFLWSSMPDEELLAHAAAGDLQRRKVLLAQVRRMTKDPRASGLATEFTGNWLGFRHFETNNSVDRERFPTFTNDLREAMFQEPIHVIDDAISNNRSILDLVYGDYTFVNPVLAKHYGMPPVKGDNKTWVRVDNASQYGRGGLLPMAVFLTQNSPGLRTSPVKRGAWVVKQVLGEVIPPPPPVVPELPHDEATSELPVRNMLAKHRENALCAACHARIDPYGLAFEGYGPVGDKREKDLAGRPVDTVVNYPGGTDGSGITGLQTFIREKRQNEYVANFSRKLLAYALNRSLQLSDELVVEEMQKRAAANDFRVTSLIETIVTSPQFLYKRVPEVQSAPQTASGLDRKSSARKAKTT